MDDLTRDLDELLRLLPAIAGGDGEGEPEEIAQDDNEPAGDEPGGVDAGGEPAEEGQPGDEESVEGEIEGQEGQEGEEGDEAAAGAKRRPQSVPYSVFKEKNDRLRAVEAERSQLLSRLMAGNGQEATRQPARQLPAEYAELDKGMGGYMRHYLDPIAEAFMQHQYLLGDMRDESRFYRGPGRTLNERQVDLVERARDGLSQRLRQPIERADALLFLRGHPQYGKLFVDQQSVQRQQLANGVVAARRVAGKVGGRAPVGRARTGPETVDLNTLPRAERVKHFERVMGNTPV